MTVAAPTAARSGLAGAARPDRVLSDRRRYSAGRGVPLPAQLRHCSGRRGGAHTQHRPASRRSPAWSGRAPGSRYGGRPSRAPTAGGPGRFRFPRSPHRRDETGTPARRRPETASPRRPRSCFGPPPRQSPDGCASRGDHARCASVPPAGPGGSPTPPLEVGGPARSSGPRHRRRPPAILRGWAGRPAPPCRLRLGGRS